MWYYGSQKKNSAVQSVVMFLASGEVSPLEKARCPGSWNGSMAFRLHRFHRISHDISLPVIEMKLEEESTTC